MKVIDFTYTDTKGKISQRTLLVQKEPYDKYMGTDISELELDTLDMYLSYVLEAQQSFNASIEALNKKFDVQHRTRQFFEDKMTNVEVTVF